MRVAWPARFLFANAALLLLAANALGREWIGPIERVSAIGTWTVLALAGAALGSALVASLLPDAERLAFLRRHFLLYLAVPLLLLLPQTSTVVAPPAFGAVYLLIPLAFAVHALAGLWRVAHALPDGVAARALAAVALVAYLALLPYHEASVVMTSDEPHYLLISQSLVLDGDLDLRNDYEGDRYLAFYPERLPDVHGFERGDAIWSVRDLGLPVLAAGPLAAAGRLGVLALMCLVGAALVHQLFLLLRELRFEPRVALLAAAATGLTHPLLTYTTQVYPELLAALTLTSAARLLRLDAGPRQLAAASALLGLLAWLSTRALLLVAGAGLVLAFIAVLPALRRAAGRWRLDARAAMPRIAAAGLPFAALFALLCYANWSMWGTFAPGAGYRAMFPEYFLMVWTPHVGATGMLFDRVFGLIPRAPLYLLAFLGAAAVWSRLRAGSPQVAALLVGWAVSFAYLANIVFWHQDGGPSSRYLVASTPFLVVAVAGGFEIVERSRAWRGALRGAATVLVTLSVLVVYAFAVLPDLRYDYARLIAPTGGPGRLFQVVGDWLGVQPELAFPSLLRIGPFSVALAALWTLAVIGLALLGGRIDRRARTA
jgi:hypothetical protein